MTITKTCLTTSLLVLLLSGVSNADQNDARLDDLFRIIQHTDNPEIAFVTENKIWDIWFQHDDKRTQERLAEGTAAMETNPSKALLIFNELVEDVPDFAEGWNRRATLYYLLREYAASASDIEKTLELEPRHFGALSGLGLVYLAQEQYAEAKSAFEAVLLIYPHNRNVQKNIEMIDDYLRRKTIITMLLPPVQEQQAPG
ncbi:MAG: tetratricopeptide repeat protein [Gammaproteobacteria bacterium]|nr:tetratricopeptide repeat protein [Gammaproteobacteria bacterium]